MCDNYVDANYVIRRKAAFIIMALGLVFGLFFFSFGDGLLARIAGIAILTYTFY